MSPSPLADLTLSLAKTFERLSASERGLTSVDAATRLAVHGPNELAPPERKALLLDILRRFANPLVTILMAAAVISAFVGDRANAVIIVMIVGLSNALDVYQTRRSQKAADSLRSQVAPTSTALRDGRFVEIARREIVPGDIVRLSAGDLVSADCRLVEAKDLHIQQAALTGESLPVEKEANAAAVDATNPADMPHAVFLGSSVVSGTATAIVVATGARTTFGDIATSLDRRPPPTEFEHGMTAFGSFIVKTVLFLTLFVFTIAAVFHHAPLEALLFALALAVGLTPEFLPMITTVTLAEGAVRMARSKVIVKKLAAIQNFGSIDVLCSDKTGTLTSGRMVLEQHLDPLGVEGEKPLHLAAVNSFFESGVDDPVDDAVLDHANINPLDAAVLRFEHPHLRGYTKVDEIPFDFERRRVSIVVEKDGERRLITKGAPEGLLAIVSCYEAGGVVSPMDAATRARSEAVFQDLSARGYRVLAVATRTVSGSAAFRKDDEVELTLVGYLAFVDPPLPDAARVIEALGKEGVNVKIITGDNELVARHVCERVGLDAGRIVLGGEIDRMTDPALGVLAETTRLFARVAPAQKNRIIAALRSRGHVVGYIGDGINDAPSLHSADVGISVAGAVDVARDAADIILLEHDLGVLLAGILEGRKAFGNVMKYLLMGTSSNFGNMFSMAGAFVFLPFLPMLPTQILLNNFLYDLAQITIPTDNVDESFVQKPRRWDIGLIRRFMIIIGPVSSIYDFATFYILRHVFHASQELFHTGWFVESLATQTLVIFVIRTSQSPWKSRPSRALTASVLAVVLVGVLLPFSPLAGVLGFTPLPAGFFVFLVGVTVTYLGLVEIAKRRLFARVLG